MKRTAKGFFQLVLAILALAPAAAQQTLAAGTAAIKEYTIPTNASLPFDIAVGPDRNLWFTERLGGKIGRISSATGALTEFSLPTPNGEPRHLTLGPDGNLWFTEQGVSITGPKIGRIDPNTGVIVEFPLPPGHSPEGITASPDGNLWFTVAYQGKIGRINPSTGEIAEYEVPNVTEAIVAGPDRALWFTERFVNRIGRFDPVGAAISEYPVPNGESLMDLLAAPDGAVWLGWMESGGYKIGRITSTTKIITAEYAIPLKQAGARGDVLTSLSMAPDGTLWFALVTIDAQLLRVVGGKIGHVLPTGAIATYMLPQQADPRAVVVGPDGNVWFTEMLNNKIGRMTPP